MSIDYSITSGKITLVRPVVESNSLQFSINSNSGGHLTVELPRNFIDAKTVDGENDFQVQVEGRTGLYIEKITANDRTLTIPYTFRVKHIEVVGTFLDINPFESNQSSKSDAIPNWIRNNAEWWSKGLIDEKDFLSGMQFLINQRIINVQELPSTTQTALPTVPNWIKDTAGWWASEKLSDQEFLSGIEYLVEHGVIRV